MYLNVYLDDLLCLLMLCCLSLQQKATLLSFTAASFYSTRTATFNNGARPGEPGSTEVQYCTWQHALLRLPAHFRQIGQICCPTGVMNMLLIIPFYRCPLCRAIPSSTAKALQLFPVALAMYTVKI
jgi:hypothetical protein